LPRRYFIWSIQNNWISRLSRLLNVLRKKASLSLWCSMAVNKASQADPLLSLRGSGKHLWASEHADDYVRRLREG
jgi:hypothetical protein